MTQAVLRSPNQGIGSQFPFQLKLPEGPFQQTPFCAQSLLRYVPDRRLVCQGTIGHDVVVAKLFFSGEKAEREWRRERDGMLAAVSAGLPVPELLFAGKGSGDIDRVLITRYVADSQTVAQCIDQHPQQLHDVLVSLAASLGELHERHFAHHDPHFGNFLISPAGVVILDADQLKHATVNELRAFDNLGLLLAQLKTSNAQLEQSAYRAYLNVRGMHGTPYRDALIRHEIARWRRYRRRKYVEKVSRDCSEVLAASDSKHRWCIRREYAQQMDERFLTSLDTCFHEQAQWLKQGNSASVIRTTHQGMDLVIKRYNFKSMFHRLRRGYRASRAQVSWSAAHLLRFVGVPTPEPVAMVVERGPLGSTGRGYFLCRAVDGESALPLIEKATPEARHRYVASLLKLFRIMYDENVAHGDFKATNFLFDTKGVPTVLDLDALTYNVAKSALDRRFVIDLQRFMRNWDNQDINQQVIEEFLPLFGKDLAQTER